MGFFERFYPDYIYKCVGDIENGFFKKNGIKYAVLDIDNTLVPYTVKAPTKPAVDFLKRLEAEDVLYCFLSNNNKKRVMLFNNNINAPYMANAKKPLLFGFNKIMKKINASEKNTILIGDQIFTDIWAGKRAGVLTLLVEPIEDKETLFFKFKRSLEKIVLNRFRKEN